MAHTGQSEILFGPTESGLHMNKGDIPLKFDTVEPRRRGLLSLIWNKGPDDDFMYQDGHLHINTGKQDDFMYG